MNFKNVFPLNSGQKFSEQDSLIFKSFTIDKNRYGNINNILTFKFYHYKLINSKFRACNTKLVPLNIHFLLNM